VTVDAKKLNWVKGCESAHCIEVAIGDKEVGIRAASTPPGGEIWATESEWVEFVKGVKNGNFDR
jgi:hypothetical protein